mmetsp:Transcript_3619/g.9188  ORF Transcript_3619/g.9188 Transcript_3619/m.9188 type:complete len:407 (-) Transcript_3619:817-2037(-)
MTIKKLSSIDEDVLQRLHRRYGDGSPLCMEKELASRTDGTLLASNDKHLADLTPEDSRALCASSSCAVAGGSVGAPHMPIHTGSGARTAPSAPSPVSGSSPTRIGSSSEAAVQRAGISGICTPAPPMGADGDASPPKLTVDPSQQFSVISEASTVTPMTPPAHPGNGDAQPTGKMPTREKALSESLLAAWEKEMNFTQSQYETLATFRKRVAEEGLSSPWADNLLNAYRFCQARDFKIDAALKMWRDHVQWRRENGLGEVVLSDDGLAPRLCVDYRMDQVPDLKVAYPFVHHKVDKQGQPVYIDRIGAMDLKKLKKACPDFSILMKYFIWYAECTMHYRMPAATLQAGRIVSRGSYIIDLKGFGLKHLTSETREFLKSVIKIMSDNYPEVQKAAPVHFCGCMSCFS